MTLYSAMKRKAERERIAALFETMAARAGATAETRLSSIQPRCITLTIRKDGVAVMLRLEGEHGYGAFLAYWFFDDRRGRLFAPNFDGYGYRPHHKATMMTETAEDLCSKIEGALLAIDDGSAFILEAA